MINIGSGDLKKRKKTERTIIPGRLTKLIQYDNMIWYNMRWILQSNSDIFCTNNYSNIQYDTDLVVLHPIDFLSISADLFDPPLLMHLVSESVFLHNSQEFLLDVVLLLLDFWNSWSLVHMDFWNSWSVWTSGTLDPSGLLDLLVPVDFWNS